MSQIESGMDKLNTEQEPQTKTTEVINLDENFEKVNDKAFQGKSDEQVSKIIEPRALSKKLRIIIALVSVLSLSGVIVGTTLGVSLGVTLTTSSSSGLSNLLQTTSQSLITSTLTTTISQASQTLNLATSTTTLTSTATMTTTSSTTSTSTVTTTTTTTTPWNSLINSLILNTASTQQLFNLIGWSTTTNLSLLYRATRDGFTASSFHTRCDGKTNTLTIIKNTNSYIFGGFTTAAWASPTNAFQVSDSNAFIWGLNNSIKANIQSIRTSSAITVGSCCGPTFGPNPSDIFISDNSNTNNFSDSNFGNAYTLPSGVTYNTAQARNLLPGSWKFQTSEIEVFQR